MIVHVRRDQKAASSCESKYKDLESKYQKLLVVVAIISGIVGKEIVEEAMSIFDKAKPAITVSEIPKVTTAEILVQDIIEITLYHLQIYLLFCHL